MSPLSSPVCGSPTVCPQLLNCIMDMAEEDAAVIDCAAPLPEADREEPANHWIRAAATQQRTARRALGRPPGPSAALWAQRVLN